MAVVYCLSPLTTDETTSLNELRQKNGVLSKKSQKKPRLPKNPTAS
jgi:hypothetical protein